MNQSEIISLISSKHNLKRDDAKAIVQTVFDGIVRSLRKRERVTVIGFGAFEIKELLNKPVRNINSGESYLLPKCTKIAFRPSGKLKQRMK